MYGSDPFPLKLNIFFCLSIFTKKNLTKSAIIEATIDSPWLPIYRGAYFISLGLTMTDNATILQNVPVGKKVGIAFLVASILQRRYCG